MNFFLERGEELLEFYFLIWLFFISFFHVRWRERARGLGKSTVRLDEPRWAAVRVRDDAMLDEKRQGNACIAPDD